LSPSNYLRKSKEVYKVMKNKNESGFSLIELIIVFVIIGILAVLTFPYAFKAKSSAENANAYATLKTMVAAQYSFYAQNSRYARLDELNNSQTGGLGVFSSNAIRRGNFTFQLDPTLTDDDLKTRFQIMATKPGIGAEPPATFTVTERGHAAQLF
jgi:prepilin-type N-terminal cleavage/methylation domain-containing protein